MSKLKTGDMFVKSIKVDGKETHAGADLRYLIEDGVIHLQTEIGRNKKQVLEIVLTKDDTNLITDEDKTITN